MDRIEQLIETTSILELAETMQATYADATAGLGIDWNFTVMQWKIGNTGCDEFIEAFPEARFKVWSLPFRKEKGEVEDTRFATCLPFQFKPSWEADQASRSLR